MACHTISTSLAWQQKIRRSTFSCVLHPIANPEEAKRLLSAHVKDHTNATHNCYAYICGLGQETQYHSDAGEPHGTAGKPILNALLRARMTNILAIVTRYYGGVKLGVPGLIKAYGDTVEQTLELAEKITATQQNSFRVTLDYALAEKLSTLVTALAGKLTETVWSEKPELKLQISAEHEERLLEWLEGYRQQNRLEYRREEN